MESQKLENESSQTIYQKKSIGFDEKNFYPKGAIVFFFLLITLGLIIWFGIYFLMLERI